MGERNCLTHSLRFRSGEAANTLRVEPTSLVLNTCLPRLAGPEEEILAQGQSVQEPLLHGSGTLAGVLVSEGSGDLAAASRQLYARLLGITQGHELYRVWNFVPQINAMTNGLENYQAFNAGRHQALTAGWGAELLPRLPAASALGTPGGALALAFVAGQHPVEHFENPLQVPALHYPEQFGKIPPAFARGSVVTHPHGTTWHLSGTASIRGHATCGADFPTQMQHTLENIAAVCSRMNVPTTRQAQWKIFLRHPHDLTHCQAAFAAAYPQDLPQAIFLQADICRADLLVEIEAIFHQLHPL